MIRFLILSHPDRRELGSTAAPAGTDLRAGGLELVLDTFARDQGFADYDALLDARPEFAAVYVEHAPALLTVIEGGRS